MEEEIVCNRWKDLADCLLESLKVKERIHRKEEMSSCNVEALTIRKVRSCAWLLHPNIKNQGKGMLEVY